MTITRMFELPWANELNEGIKYIALVGVGSHISFNIECFVKNQNLSIHPEFLKTILFLIVPIGVILAFLFIWMFICCCWRNKFKTRYMIQTIIVFFHLILPTLAYG